MSKPYYQDEWVTIMNEDSRNISNHLTVDAVITDPPYGVRKDSWDDKLEFAYHPQEWLTKFRIISPIVIWFCSGRWLPQMLEGRKDFHRLLIWNKPPGTQFAGSSHNNLWYSFEPILVFGKKEYITKKGRDSKYSYSVFNAPTIAENTFNHPTSKPESLMDWLILHYTNAGDTILDPFLGSGTTAWCAKKLGRKCIGYEINKKHCKTAMERCRQQVMKLT